MRLSLVASVVTTFAVLLVLLALAYEDPGLRQDAQRQARVVELQKAQIVALEKALRDAQAQPATRNDTAPRDALPQPAVAPSNVSGTSAKRQHWYWTDLVMDSLRPFKQLSGGITMEGLRLAEQKCKQSTYCHRAQVIDGRLYITDLRAIFFDRNYGPARVMPLLETLRRWPVPNFDAIFQGTDYPIGEIPRDAAHMQRMYGRMQRIPPIFSPTATTVHLDLPWPDFAFFPPVVRCGKDCEHPLKTPRWTKAHRELLEIGRTVPWEKKIGLAVFTGNMMGALRQEMYKLAETNPSLMFVNEVFIKTNPPSCFTLGVPQPTEGGVLSKKCGLSFPELCKYKYLLNVGSNGYANKLRFLFLCGSVVLWVRDGSLNHEFFERQFVPGIHYAPVDKVSDLPDAIRRLQDDDGFARQLALAGQQRMAQMDVEEVTHFCYQMLKGYAAIQRFTPKRDPRSWEVNCEDDLIRHYDRHSMLRTGGGSGAVALEHRYLTEDNASCLRPPPPGVQLGPPGWGGAYNGSKVPCYAAHDLSAPEEKGKCEPTHKERALDGPDWDIEEAYKGGALPDWRAKDPAITGKAAPVIPWGKS